MQGLPSLNSECIAIFLVCGFMFHLCALFQENRRFRLHFLAASMYLAYLALTKIFFGYVIAAILAFLLVWRMCRPRAYAVRTALGVFLLALLWCTPYLFYMYSATGKIFYWGTSGGMLSIGCPRHIRASTGVGLPVVRYGTGQSWRQWRVFREPKKASRPTSERDAAFKRTAIRNIESRSKGIPTQLGGECWPPTLLGTLSFDRRL